MAENPVGHEKRKGVKGKLALAGATALTVAVGLLGADQEAKPVSANADTPTPIATPTGTPTPTSVEKQIADAQATVTALEKRRKDEQQLADLKAKEEALKASPTATPTRTPTRVPAEATATADAIRLRALGEEQARGKATATAEANLTATVESRREAATATAEARTTAGRTPDRNQDAGIPVVPLALGAAAGVAGWASRRRIIDATRTQGGRLVRAVRSRLHI